MFYLLHLSGLHEPRCLTVEPTPALHQTEQEWTTDIIIYKCMVSLKTSLAHQM